MSTYSPDARSIGRARKDSIEGDPFTLTPSTGNSGGRPIHRYSSFDTKLFTSYTRGSPTQAKRALEAHLVDTDRRIQDASILENTLLEQKKELAERLQDIEAQSNSSEVGPELKQRLIELEREYNEVGRETARQFIPKNRRLNSNSGDAMTHAPVLIADGRDLSSKPVSPSRKQRKMPMNQVHDIEFATQISTSLLAQVRQLQSVLAEKEEALRQSNAENSKLQSNAETYALRLRSMDENEQRFKDDTWQMETQIQQLSAEVRGASTREQRSNQTLDNARADKSAMEREHDELRQAHYKLSDDHDNLRRQHDAELLGMTRSLAAGENERDGLQRKIEDLVAQNEDLARAMSYRNRTEDSYGNEDPLLDENMLALEPTTPEHSPPLSPTKATPRHGALESETLKSSLHHAHRMIQNLKNNIHREKTEKLELKRMLQDARDELEARKAEGGNAAGNAGRKHKTVQSDAFKKPHRLTRLGGAKATREEILNDPSWEECEDSPTKARAAGRDDYDLSTDASDAFETANERDSITGTEGFQTGLESIAGDSNDDLTETEETQGLRSRDVTLARLTGVRRASYKSTASDDADLLDLCTPPADLQSRYKPKVKSSPYRRIDETANMRDSPASIISNAPPHQDLAAELDGLGNDSSTANTPARTVQSFGGTPDVRTRDVTPCTSVLKPVMVDTGMLTDPWVPAATAQISGAGMEAIATGSPPSVFASSAINHDRAASAGASEEVPAPHVHERLRDTNLDELACTNLSLQMSAISTQHIEPTEPEFSIPSTTRLLPATNGVPTSTPSHELEQDATPLSAVDPELAAVAPSMAFIDMLTKHTNEQGVTGILMPYFDPNVAPSFAGDLIVGNTSASNEVVSTGESTVSDPDLPTSTLPLTNVVDASAPVDDSVDWTRDPSSILPTSVPVGHIPDSTRIPEAPSNSCLEKDIFDSQEHESQAPVSAHKLIRLPFEPVSGNATMSGTVLPAPAQDYFQRLPTKSEGTQTLVSADGVWQAMKDRKGKGKELLPAAGFTITPPASMSPSQEHAHKLGTLTEGSTSTENGPSRTGNRPTSLGAFQKLPFSPTIPDLPPLPLDHREVIAAASRNSSALGNMSPPPPPSSWRSPRPRTPSGATNQSPIKATPNSYRGNRGGSIAGRSEGTRRSSVSSFASEVEERFNLSNIGTRYNGQLFEMNPNTDPRMIQAITQTMIGEFLWKYTRKAGRGEHSTNRHRRFFWIHPYTRTLYWSDQDPSRSGRNELKAKSVAIEAVRVVSDDNPIPPGLYPKSIIVVTPGRSIKFSAPTNQRHETWFNALSYLLLRNTSDGTEERALAYSSVASRAAPSGGHERSDTVTSINSDDISEFSPIFSTRANTSQSRSATAMSNRSPSAATGNYPSIGVSSSLSKRAISPPVIQSQQGPPQYSSLAVRQSQAAQKRAKSTNPNKMYYSTNSLPGQNQNAVTDVPQDYYAQEGFVFPSGEATITTDATTSVDEDGFRKPTARPASAASRPGSRVGSMTSKTISMFRGRSKSRAGRDESVDDVAQPPIPVGGGLGTVENVRACCDGKHDVGSLDHRHSSRSRSRLPNSLSVSSRYSNTTGTLPKDLRA